jgi:hypothetical protein
MLGVTLALALPAQAEAQWMAGAKAGFGQGAFTGTTEFVWQSGATTFSIFANGVITPSIALQAELYLTEKNGQSRVTGSNLTMRADYLVLPLLVRMAPPVPGPVKPYFLAGPSLVFEVRCQVRFVTVGLVSTDDCNNTSGDLNRTDVGIEGGAGLEIGLGPANLLLEARGNTNVGTVVVPTETRTSRSFSWSLMTGVSVPLRARTGARALPGERRPAPPRMDETVQGVTAPEPTSSSGLPALPTLPAESLVEERQAPPRVENLNQRISVRAIDADARALLIGIANQAGINMVVSSDVNRRVSLTLHDVPAMQAIQEIAIAASLTIATPESRALPAVVYYQLPVNVNSASAETIAKRFGVSEELARFIVESRNSQSQSQRP